MARTRRIVVDNDDSWTFRVEYVYEPGDVILARQDDYVELSFEDGYEGTAPNLFHNPTEAHFNYVVWSVGLITFGTVTQAQRDFVATMDANSDLSLFPGDYVAFGAAGVANAQMFIGIQSGRLLVRFGSLTVDDVVITVDGVDIAEVPATGQTGLRLGGFEHEGGGSVALIDVLPAIEGWVGSDMLYGTDAPQRIYGFDGADALFGLGGGDHLDGGAGDDRLEGGAGTDALFGGAGHDWLEAGVGFDTMSGGDGDDTFVYRAGNEIDGGGGNDRVIADLGGSASVVLAVPADGSIAQLQGSIVNVEVLEVTGSAQTDILEGGGGRDFFKGGQGFDLLRGGGGNDVLDAGGSAGGLRGVVGEGQSDITDLLARTGLVTLSNVLNGFFGGGASEVRALVLEVPETTGPAPRVLTVDLGAAFTGGFASLSVTLYDAAFQVLATEVFDGASSDPELVFELPQAAGTYSLQISASADETSLTYSAEIALASDQVLTADRMEGGNGDDYYYVRSASDQIVEAGGGGNDRVFAGVSYVLTAGAEIEMLGTANNAGTAAINLTGNGFSQTVFGNAGANTLSGGTAGDDILHGYGGNDSYVVNSQSDQVIEAAGQGTDTVFASVSYALANTEVEVLRTTSQAGTGAINLTGNAFSQTIHGNNGINTLSGGNAGDDILYGYGGNDSYVVNGLSDQVIESAGQGTDTVFASASYALAAGTEIEVLRTTSQGGTGAIDLTGNSFSQTIHGNAGANVLSGGTAGDDILYGYGGNDSYVVNSQSDQVFESAGQGSDTVFASAHYGLAATAEVEVLRASSLAATTAINLVGSNSAQTIVGNAGANTIDGRGGADTLHGWSGADSFAFRTALGPGNVDTVGDYSVADDRILLDDAVFAGLALGALAAGAFTTGAAASQADDRIVYNSATGALLFDADGSGAGAAVQFATLSAGLAMSAGEFTVI